MWGKLTKKIKTMTDQNIKNLGYQLYLSIPEDQSIYSFEELPDEIAPNELVHNILEKYLSKEGDDIGNYDWDSEITPIFNKIINAYNFYVENSVVKVFSDDINYDAVSIRLLPTHKAYWPYLNYLMKELEMTKNDAKDYIRRNPIELEFVFQPGQGFFAVEADVVSDCGDIYSPYNKKRCI